MTPENTTQLAELKDQLKALTHKKETGEQLTPSEEISFTSLTNKIAAIEKEG